MSPMVKRKSFLVQLVCVLWSVEKYKHFDMEDLEWHVLPTSTFDCCIAALCFACLVYPILHLESHSVHTFSVQGVVVSAGLACMCIVVSHHYSLDTCIDICFGLMLCVVERFCAGFLLAHCTPARTYYTRCMLARKLYHVHSRSEDILELVAYGAYGILLAWPLGIRSPGLWAGIALEHYVGHGIRAIVQSVSSEVLWDPTTTAPRFLRQVNAYYWYPMLVDWHACYGFSSPLLDVIVSRRTSCTGLCPLPFLGFCWSNFYELHSDRLQQAWKQCWDRCQCHS